MQGDISYIESEINLFKLNHKNFDIIEDEDKFVLSGLLEIDKFGDYEVEIDIPKNYPKVHPVIKETGGDIPKINDRHINGDGTCCIAIKYRISEYLKEDPSIINFIEKYVKPYFANQLYFTSTGRWINGEYSHGIEGEAEYIAEECNIDIDLSKIFMLLSLKSLVNWNKKCPCGSMKSMKKCHKTYIIKIKKLMYS